MFNQLVGQEHIKRKLRFYAEQKKSSETIPFIMFNGAAGLGKTQFAKDFAKELETTRFLEINCSTIKNGERFFDQIFIPAIVGENCTVLFDEAHMLPRDLMNAFLTVFNVEGAKTKRLQYGDSSYTFDFTSQNYLFATTELDKVFQPLQDRLTVIDFTPYGANDLKEIVRNKVEWVEFEAEVLDDVVSTVKGNARSAVKRALEIESYCNVNHRSQFTHSDWKELKNLLDIRPFGLTNTEVQVLENLREHGPSTLQMLSVFTGMSRTALQRGVERNLLRCGFMTIDGKRMITSKGLEVLNNIG